MHPHIYFEWTEGNPVSNSCGSCSSASARSRRSPARCCDGPSPTAPAPARARRLRRRTLGAVNHDLAQDWLDRYVTAWLTYEPDLIGDLFSADVTYRYHPYDVPVVGREAVVASWTSSRDAMGTYDAQHAPVAVDGEVVVATGTSAYRDEPGGPVVRAFDNCFVLRFDGDGRCREFTEYYVKRASGLLVSPGAVGGPCCTKSLARISTRQQTAETNAITAAMVVMWLSASTKLARRDLRDRSPVPTPGRARGPPGSGRW